MYISERDNRFTFMNKFMDKLSASGPPAQHLEAEEKSIADQLRAFLAENTNEALYIEVVTELLLYEVKTSTSQTTFRDRSSYGCRLLSDLWFKREGLLFFRDVITPVLEVVAKIDHPMEVDPSSNPTTNVKANIRELLRIAELFLEKLYECETMFSVSMIDMFKRLNFQVALSHQNADSILIGGLLMLRLISPVIILPWVYGVIDENRFTLHGKKALILLSRVIQSLASGAHGREDYMKSISLWTKRQLPKWKSFFHHLLGMNNIGEDVEIQKLVAEDIIEISNSNLGDKGSDIIDKQCGLVSFLLEIENETNGWESEKNRKNHPLKVSFRKLDEETFLHKGEIEIPASLEDVYEWTLANVDAKNKLVIRNRTVETYNENLCVNHIEYNMPFPFSNRDVLLLEYHECIPEEKFAIMCRTSVENDNAPITKEFIRGDTRGGYIFRELEKDKTQVSQIYHVNAGGNFSSAPDFLLRWTSKKEAKKLLNILKHFTRKQ